MNLAVGLEVGDVSRVESEFLETVEEIGVVSRNLSPGNVDLVSVAIDLSLGSVVGGDDSLGKCRGGGEGKRRERDQNGRCRFHSSLNIDFREGDSIVNDYDLDFYAWTQRQSALLRSREWEKLDWDNLAEEIESMGKRERRELINRLCVLVGDLLKWKYQSERRCASWEATIAVQRDDIQDLLLENPSLKPFLEEAFLSGYKKGRLLAIADTNLQPSTFPVEPPFDLEYTLTGDL
ncbi:hypothetical protein CKA32_003952 [Geitlerinema sp. FC II]|nr:hypothetical protein CKA32_003952 [Geitlerinema sp. FC II]